MAEMQFSIRFLLTVTAIFASLAYGFASPSHITLFTSCVLMPTALALTSRYALNRNHGDSSVVAFSSAILIGGAILGWWSYDQTFNKDAIGIFVGEGWESVKASAIIGTVFGAFCGAFSIMLYFLAALGMDRMLEKKTKQNVG